MRLRDTPSAIFLMLLILVSSQRLYATNWATGLGTALLLSLLGTILGLFLGASRFRRLVVFLLAVGYSLATLPLVTLWNLYKNIPWIERLVSLGSQLGVSTVELFTGQPVQDSTLFVVFAGVVYWIIGLTAGYTLMRYGKFAGVVVPAGVVLFIIQLFDMREGDHVYILAVYVFLCLLLLGRLTYIRKKNIWKERRVWVSAEAITDLNIIIGASALALVLLVWVAPVSGRPITSARIMWENATRPWRQKQQDLNKTIQSLQSNQVGTIEFYGDTLGLGRQAETGDDTVFDIRAPLTGGAERYYWRVRTYDLYQNDQWFTNYAFDEPFIPSEGSLSIADPQGTTAEFVITVPNQNLSTMVTPPRPIWTNRPSRLTFTPSTPGKIDPLMFMASPTILAGQEYLVHADIYEPSAAQLRNAGVDYPTWVSNHYLELPADLPPEIGNLARQITAGLFSPYDQADAITNYLRKNITYSTTVGTPPPGRDALAWFLFDTKTGFCNYYATAEVVLLRSLGIPARMAVGFAQGEYEPPNQFTVRQKDEHAWPEVYFPGNGWVQFEPTASQPPLVRPEGSNSSAGQLPTPTAAGTPGGNNSQQPPLPLGEGGPGAGIPQSALVRLTIIFLVGILLIAAGFVAYFFGFFDKIIAYLRKTFQKPLPVVLKNALENLGLTAPGWLVRWAYLSELTPAERAFAVVYRSLHWLGAKTTPAQTPSEAAAELSGAVPGASKEIQALLEQCQRSLYSQDPADLVIARRAADIIQRASLRAAIQARWRAFRVILKLGIGQKKPSDAP